MFIYNKLIEKLNYIVEEERNNFILWLPVFFIVGSLVRFNYFESGIDIKYLNISLLFITIFFLIIGYKTKNLFIRIISIILIFILLGYLRTEQSIKKYNYPTIEKPIGKVKIIGTVEKEIIGTNKTIIVSIDKIESLNNKKNFPKNKIPKKLKIRLSNNNQEISLSKIILTAYVFPIEKKLIYSDFDNKKYLYFQKIGGLGYRGEIIYNEKIKNNKLSIKQKIDLLRYKIATKIINVKPNSKSTGIIAILLTGQKNLADKQTIENMNMSGLAHILAISGLHIMTLILSILYLSNWVLTRSEKLILNYNIQKISIVISLIISFLYLLLSGMSVSAIRAYIMSIILMFSTILGRFNTSSRSIMFTMFLFVFIKPYVIFSAGFQMSFMSVIALITAMDIYNKNIDMDGKFYKIYKYKRYITTGFTLSIAAELAVTPFVIYNFNYYSFYNIFVNSFITPIVSFIVLPLGLLSLLLMPFKLEALLILPASYAMDIIIYIVNFIVKIQNSFIFVRSPSIFCFFLMILGLFLFCLLKSGLRKVGIVLYLLAFIIFFLQKNPDIIVDNRNKSLIFTDEKNNFYVLKPNKYKIAGLLRKFGKRDYCDLEKVKLDSCGEFENKSCTKLNVEEGFYHFYKNGEELVIVEDNDDFSVVSVGKKLRILELY